MKIDINLIHGIEKLLDSLKKDEKPISKFNKKLVWLKKENISKIRFPHVETLIEKHRKHKHV